jgi:xylulokinase
MKKDLLAGVDIGTQGTRAALYTLEGAAVAEASEPSVLLRPSAGAVEEDPERQYRSVVRSLRACLEKAGVGIGRVAALAIDGQMAGVIGVGADGAAVTPYDSWLDTRCASYIAEMESRAGDEVLRKTGNVPSFNHGPKILWWKGERASAYARVVAFVQPAGYAAMRLCGLDGGGAFIDDTYLHFSGFADNAARIWDEGLCSTFSVERSKLPRIASPTEIVGRLSREAAAATGLLEGTPVAAGLGDTAASFLACGAAQAGVCVDVSGTASVFAATVSSFAADTISRVMGCGRSAIAGLWHPYAYINGGGLALNWFAESIASGRGAPGGGGESLELALARLGEEIAGLEPRLDDPYFVPHMDGRNMPSDPEMRGAWAGLSRSHDSARLYRAVLESVALEYAMYRDAVRALHPSLPLSELRITGGGAKEPSWNEIKADVLGMRTVAVESSGGAPMGAALVAGAAVGVLPNLAAAAKSWARLGSERLPDPALAPLYASRLGRYKSLLRALSGFPGAQSA